MNSQQNTENIESLLSAESTTIEFKELLNYSKSEKEKQWLKTISAFANTKGGKIVVGVTEDKKSVFDVLCELKYFCNYSVPCLKFCVNKSISVCRSPQKRE